MSPKQVMTMILVFSVLMIFSGCSENETPTPTASATKAAERLTEVSPSPPEPTSTTLPAPTPTPNTDHILNLRSLISQEQHFTYIEDLTNLQAYSGWRNSATEGEAEALDYVAGVLSDFDHLQSLGLEVERQLFRVYVATEIWESRVYLIINGEEHEVPANAISGHRKDVRQALRFDSDGEPNDSDRNPLDVTGDVLLLRSGTDVMNLAQEEAQGKVVLLDYAAIEPASAGAGAAARLVTDLIAKGIAGLVLVTEDGHGKYAGDGTILEEIDLNEVIPKIYVRLEDLSAVDISSWEAFPEIEAARIIWDTDVFSPGKSGNLVARIPGEDSSRAVILGAHIDSANSPGAGDNALNAAALLELARVLNEGIVQPPIDIYLVWFGSHEIGLYGSQYFVNTHQDLLDRTLAAFLMDGFTADRPGPTILGMQEASHARFGDAQLPFADYLAQKAQDYQVPIDTVFDSDIFSSDDGPFYGFVPQVRFAFGSNRIGKGFHSPYDTLENIQDQGDVMEQSVLMALIAGLETPRDVPDLRITPDPERRALIIATHTEVLHMSPTLLINLVRSLAWEGFDVDVIPYGQSLNSGDLTDADLVLVLPVIDYPNPDVDQTQYGEEWFSNEINLLEAYVEQGGLLVLTNSANRLFFGEISDANEDWEMVNTLAAPFGILYEGVPFPKPLARVAGEHILTENLPFLLLVANNGIPISLHAGESLAEIDGQIALALVDHGEDGGQVLVLSDVGSLDLYNFGQQGSDNFDFLRNLARYARDR
ncbi:MAG: M28 family peptidase [Anaerolineales bacterium]|nr:M28 family peptidase [Anaerolineales bacterium]